MPKQALTQRSFILGEIREGFLEGDDLELRQASVRKGENCRITATRSMRSRPGSFWVREGEDAYDLIELRPEADLTFGLVILDDALMVINSEGGAVHTEASVPWTDASTVWVEPFREETVIGGPFGLYELVYDDGSWTFQTFTFDDAASGERAQPYWSFVKDTTITPSAREGVVTITASKSLFSAGYVGLRIRYGQREIEIASVTSPTLATGLVISTLPPSYRVTVASTIGFRTGDAVVGNDTDFQGVIVGIDGLNLDVVTTAFFDGPDVNEDLSSPGGSSKVTAKLEILPLPSFIWDEPLMSPVRGYPRAGASAGGRLTLVDFPLVPDAICMSSSRDVKDFKAGADDDDAIIRTAGDNSPRFLHVVNAGDLLLFSDRGLYYLSLRDGGILTPANFNIILFDKRSASPVRPVVVDDGAVFVEASGEAIAAAQLIGNVNLKWSVRTISTYHDPLIKSPIKLCGPSLFSEAPEKYMFVINNDGTVAAVSWFSDFQADSVGFLPWSTDGLFRTISPIFGGYWAIVDREVAGVTRRFIERLSDDAMLDCSVPVFESTALEVNGLVLEINGAPLMVSVAGATPLADQEVHLYGGGFYGGIRTVGSDGVVPDLGDMPVATFAGFNFEASIIPWPVERIDTPRAGMLEARLIRGSVSVLHSGPFDIRANRNTRTVGGYRWGEDLTIPPPLRTERYRFSVVGRRDHPEIEISKTIPGPFEVLAITQEVQI